ncbi:MAG: hypothetical protein M3376_12145 [Actinomycetota bacterium]|nr:hypothetical protein [Actinomycetota bacterium]
MAEQDPREYRGGVQESGDEKGNEGVVPREMVDDPDGQDPSDPQALGGGVLGEVTDKDPHDSGIDESGGDGADATKGETGRTAESADELTDDNTKSKWDAGANAALGDTGKA